MGSRELTIPFEVADGIAKASLIDAREYLQSELDQWKSNPKTRTNPTGYWMHPEDVVNNIRLIEALNLLINYYGGE